MAKIQNYKKVYIDNKTIKGLISDYIDNVAKEELSLEGYEVSDITLGVYGDTTVEMKESME